MNNPTLEQRLKLANLPSPIYRLDRTSQRLGKNIFIKRDDYTGSELSGNKIRKLEYSLFEAQKLGADVVITCGGIQSNHCRATAGASAKCGLKSHLLLRINEMPNIEGNYFIDKIFGAKISFCNPHEYSTSRDEIMQSIAQEYISKGLKPYIIPEGASNAVGSLGYFKAFSEILEQEKELKLKFDTIVIATGSGGTYSGLWSANLYFNSNKNILGFAVCDSSEYFKNRVLDISADIPLSQKDWRDKYGNTINFNDKYIGEGYAISKREELEFIYGFAKEEGIIFDPVYTGKAFYGLQSEILKGELKESENILFIHTGGLFGLFPKSNQFNFF